MEGTVGRVGTSGYKVVLFNGKAPIRLLPRTRRNRLMHARLCQFCVRQSWPRVAGERLEALLAEFAWRARTPPSEQRVDNQRAAGAKSREPSPNDVRLS